MSPLFIFMIRTLLVLNILFSQVSYASNSCAELYEKPSRLHTFFKKPAGPTPEKEHLGGALQKYPFSSFWDSAIERYDRFINTKIQQVNSILGSRVTRLYTVADIKNLTSHLIHPFGYEVRPIMALIDFIYDRPVYKSELTTETPPEKYWFKIKLPGKNTIYFFPKNSGSQPDVYRLWYKMPAYFVILVNLIVPVIDDVLDHGTEVIWNIQDIVTVHNNQPKLLKSMYTDYRFTDILKAHKDKKLDDKQAAAQVFTRQQEYRAISEYLNSINREPYSPEIVARLLSFSVFRHLKDYVWDFNPNNPVADKLNYNIPEDKKKIERLFNINRLYFAKETLVRAHFENTGMTEKYNLIINPEILNSIYETYYFKELSELHKAKKINDIVFKLALQEIEYWKKTSLEEAATNTTTFDINERINETLNTIKKYVRNRK